MLWCNLIVVLASAPAARAFNFFSYNPDNLEFPSTKEDKWFAQNLDHFDPSNTKIWKQRYQVNGTWFKGSKDSPIFLVVGGESPLSSENKSVTISGAGPCMHYAKKFGALCFKLEHRYYGKSRPTEDLSVENLRFLSSKQALADIAHFIVTINKLYKFQPTNKWILFGGSYAGSLVAWARLKFPHLVQAAVASSAPLMAVVDFKEYFNAVKQTLTSSRESCAENVHQGALDIGNLLEDPKGVDVLSEKFELCEPIDPLNEKDKVSLSSLVFLPAILVQYNDKFSTNVDDVCDIMVDESYGSLIDRYAAVNSLLRHWMTHCQEPSPCFPNTTYNKTIDSLKNVSYTNEAGGRQWIYQTCTEFGYYRTSTTKEELFGSSMSLDYHVGICEDVFGGDFNLTRIEDGVEKTNTEYGGVNISISRVIFTHGSVDPWRVLGITESSDPEIIVINIQGASHCNDMKSPQLFDPRNLKAARQQIMDVLGKWIPE